MRIAACLILFAFGGVGGCRYFQFASSHEVLDLDVSPPEYVLFYGSHELQFGHLRLPQGPGPHPVAVVIHGGCWRSIADIRSTEPIAADLASHGLATWSIEYRPIDRGGAWPGTFTDVASAIDFLRSVSRDHALDLERVVAVGHSAGGHLAVWAAARHRIPAGSPLFRRAPLRLAGAVSLAGPADLEALRPVDDKICGTEVVDRLLGGSPDRVTAHYAAGSPRRLLPIGVPLRFVTGQDDRVIAPRYADAFVRAARAAGDDAVARTISETAHFEPVIPRSRAWAAARTAVLDLVARGGDRSSP